MPQYILVPSHLGLPAIVCVLIQSGDRTPTILRHWLLFCRMCVFQLKCTLPIEEKIMKITTHPLSSSLLVIVTIVACSALSPQLLNAQFHRPGKSPSSRFPSSQNFPSSRHRSSLPSSKNMRPKFGSSPNFSHTPNRTSRFPSSSKPSIPSSSRPSFPSSPSNSFPKSSSHSYRTPSSLRHERNNTESSEQNGASRYPRYGRLIGVAIRLIIGLVILLGGGGAAGYFALSRNGRSNNDDNNHQTNQSNPSWNDRDYNPYRDG